MTVCFHRSDVPRTSVKALKEAESQLVMSIRLHSYQDHSTMLQQEVKVRIYDAA